MTATAQRNTEISRRRAQRTSTETMAISSASRRRRRAGADGTVGKATDNASLATIYARPSCRRRRRRYPSPMTAVQQSRRLRRAVSAVDAAGGAAEGAAENRFRSAPAYRRHSRDQHTVSAPVSAQSQSAPGAAGRSVYCARTFPSPPPGRTSSTLRVCGNCDQGKLCQRRKSRRHGFVDFKVKQRTKTHKDTDNFLLPRRMNP
jgi:hypothetical protein